MPYTDRGSPARPRSQSSAREDNLKGLFNRISASESMTRAELVRLTGLSPSTVSSLVDDLVREKLVREVGLANPSSGAGRRPILLRVNASGRQIPVFLLSRWGVSYVLFDLKFRVLEHSFRPHLTDLRGGAAVQADGSVYAQIIEDLLFHQARRFKREKAVAVLVSYPGVYLGEEGYLLTAMHTAFRREMVADLESRLGLKLFMGNSSISLAYAEKKYLEAIGRPVNDLIYVNVCDGVGAGILRDNERIMETDHIAGEIGHITIQVGGRPCPCGNHGCLEQYVNVNAVLDAAREAIDGDRGGTYDDRMRDLLTDMTLEKLGRCYESGVEPVCRALDDIAEKLFAGIYSTVCVTGIKCIVIGGGIERLGAAFLAKLNSFPEGRRMAMMKGLSMMYPHVAVNGECIGLAQMYIDKFFTIR